VTVIVVAGMVLLTAAGAEGHSGSPQSDPAATGDGQGDERDRRARERLMR
jgi:hypothetical protein